MKYSCIAADWLLYITSNIFVAVSNTELYRAESCHRYILYKSVVDLYQTCLFLYRYLAYTYMYMHVYEHVSMNSIH